MKKEVKEAIDKGISARTKILSDLTLDQKTRLLEELFRDFFTDQHRLLQKWAALTGQTAQVDTGYISQFVASIVTGIPGQGFRGKGYDLIDGSEVKSAANISGVDRPRWNHAMGTRSDDEARRKRREKTVGEKYFESPMLFYMLVDRCKPDHADTESPIRVRAWCIDVAQDTAWRNLVNTFHKEKTGATYNFQLHPPVGHDDNLVVNTLGNLDFSEVLLFDFRLKVEESKVTSSWHIPLTQESFPPSGRTTSLPYEGRTSRKSNYTAPEDLVADVAILPTYFPEILANASSE